MIHRHRLTALLSLAAPLLGACKDPPAPPAPPSASPAVASGTPAITASAVVRPPAPISGALPDAAPSPLDRRAECAKEACAFGHVVPDEVRPALSDGAPAVIWEQVIAERASVVFPRDEVVEVMGVVLDGSVDLTAMEEAPKHSPVGGRWAAFRAPGGGVTLNGQGGRAARVALVVVTTEPGKALGAHLAQRDRPGAPPSWNWKARPSRIEITSFADRPDLAWGGGALHARIAWETEPRPAAALSLLRFSPDAGVATHVHASEWEIIAAFEGDGVLVKTLSTGEERLPVKQGAIVNVPSGRPHAFQPSGKAPFFALQVYAPPGPEQRFKKLAR